MCRRCLLSMDGKTERLAHELIIRTKVNAAACAKSYCSDEKV